MIILVALFVFALIYIGNAPVRHDQALGREAYDRQTENFHRRNKETAEKYDCYYERNQLPSLDINQNFYGDGSLKRDSSTGRTYNKGQYYVDSRGRKANGQYDSTKKRPE